MELLVAMAILAGTAGSVLVIHRAAIRFKKVMHERQVDTAQAAACLAGLRVGQVVAIPEGLSLKKLSQMPANKHYVWVAICRGDHSLLEGMDRHGKSPPRHNAY